MLSDRTHPTRGLSLTNDWQPGIRWKIIKSLRWHQILKDEETVYLISIKWWTCWRMREAGMPGMDSSGDSVMMAPPIDTMDLWAKHMEVIPSGLFLPLGMKCETDFVVVPISAWHLLKTW